jgi:alpha-1,6-mannosyltransferase
MIRLGILGACLFALTMAGLSLHVPGALGVGSIALKTWFVVIGGASLGVYLLAVAMVLRGAGSWGGAGSWRVGLPKVGLPGVGSVVVESLGVGSPGVRLPRVGSPATGARGAVWVVLVVAAALRLPLIVSPPFLSTDVYRYVWDGRVQAAGVNPYRYLPADPALVSLRDDLVYPRINRADYAPTIYPPVAEMLYGAAGVLWSSVTAMKAMMVGFEVLAVFCLLRLLSAAALPAERVLIYAWNPLPVWAFAGNGHIDAAVIGLISAALLLRARHRDAWSGVVLGLAILTKFLPAVMAPVLWRRHFGWRTAATAIATIVALYAVYSSVGLRVFGFLSGYGSEEGYGSGEGFWLLAGLSRLTALPPAAVILYKIGVVVLLGGLAVWFAFVRRPDDPVSLCAAAGVMMAVLTFAISPHYPWYFAWLAVPCVLAPSPPVVWLSAAPILMYLDTFGDRFVWPSVVYVPAVLLALILLALARLRPAHSAAPIKGTT